MKNKSPCFQFYPDKALAGTVHLTEASFKAYWRLIWWMWLHSKNHYSMPDDDYCWSAATGIDLEEYPEKLQRVRDEIMNPNFELLKRKETKSGNFLINSGLKKEAEKQKKRRKQKREAAKARWDKELGRCGNDAPASPPNGVPQCPPSPSPSPSSPMDDSKDTTNVVSPDWAVVKNLWNDIAENVGLSKLKTLTDKRKQKYKIRIKEAGGEAEFWSAVREEVGQLNDFSLGLQEGSSWAVTFDFIINSEENFVKLTEGKYRKSDKGGQNGKGHERSDGSHNDSRDYREV